MVDAQEQVPHVLMQALLSRMDHLEFNLIRRSQDDIADIRGTVGNIQRARRALAAEESSNANPAVTVSHRGLGSVLAAAAPEPAVITTAASPSHHTGPGPSDWAKGIMRDMRRDSPAPGREGSFTQAMEALQTLVASRPTSVSLQQSLPATLPPAAHPRSQLSEHDSASPTPLSDVLAAVQAEA